LRIEYSRYAVAAESRKGRCGIEEAEVTGIRHVNDAVLDLVNRPRDYLVESPRGAEVELRQLRSQLHHIQRGHN
jgi:hypothetical protein